MKNGEKNTMKEYFIFIANYWGTTNGGISTFNYDLSRAIAKRRTGKKQVTVCLLLHSINDIEKTEIMELYKLKLFSLLDSDDESNEGCEITPKFLRGLKNILHFKEEDSLIWIGHDIKTGNYANICKKEYGGKSLIFNHMNYSEYYFLATRNEKKEEEKENLQKKVIQNADWVCAVGPVLKDYSEDIRNEVGKNNVMEFIPGLLDVNPVTPVPNTYKVLFFGRVDEKNNYVKQPKLAIAAFANAYEKDRKENHGVFKNNPRMEVYGYSEINDTDKSALEELIREYTSESLNVTPKKYIENRDRLKEVIRASSLCIMVSRHEGFGLTAYEAISAGVPVIISDNTGLDRFLKSKNGKDVKSLYKSVHIEGTFNQSGKPTSSDLETVTNAILDVLINYKESKTNALLLRKILYEEQFTWDNQAGTLINQIYDLQDGRNDVFNEEPVKIWDRDVSKVDLSHYLAYDFLPNMCDLLLGCVSGEYSNYVKCVLVRFDKNNKVRRTLLVAGNEPQDIGKTRFLGDGVVGMMIHQNMEYGTELSVNCNTPIFYNFSNDKGYVLVNEMVDEFETKQIPGEQDENVRAILAFPLIHNKQMEGAVTLDFYNLALLHLEESNLELQKMMRHGKKCISNLVAIIFNNYDNGTEDI